MNVKQAAVSAKNFVVKHKTPIAVAGAVTLTVIATRKMGSVMYETAKDFMEEKGLLEEFYATMEEVTD